METLVDAFRCKLSGEIMANPVIVHTSVNSDLVCGESYESAVLECWLLDKCDTETRFGPNNALKAMINAYRRVEINEIW